MDLEDEDVLPPMPDIVDDFDMDIDDIIAQASTGQQEQRPLNVNQADISNNPHNDNSTGGGISNLQRLNEEAEANATRVPKRRPQHKIDLEILLSERGLPYINRKARKLNFKTAKGYEAQNLSKLLHFFQVWVHEMDSNISFENGINKIEKLCRDKRSKIYLNECMQEERRKKLGLVGDNFTRDEDTNNNDQVEEQNEEDQEEQEQDNNASNKPTQQSQLDEETLARIKSNRAKALEKLAKKRRKWEEDLLEQDQAEAETNTDNNNKSVAPLF